MAWRCSNSERPYAERIFKSKNLVKYTEVKYTEGQDGIAGAGTVFAAVEATSMLEARIIAHQDSGMTCGPLRTYGFMSETCRMSADCFVGKKNTVSGQSSMARPARQIMTPPECC
jgi:hypothetical protein